MTAYEYAGAGYGGQVKAWIANPHAYFRSFGPEARTFQARHRSERFRTMTLVALAEELIGFRPVCLSVDGSEVAVASWEEIFATAAARLIAAHPTTFSRLQCEGQLVWLGCAETGAPVGEVLEVGLLKPHFETLAEVVARVQWLFLMCGIRLNEVIVQVDPYTDEEWIVRKADLDRRRARDFCYNRGHEKALLRSDRFRRDEIR